MHKTSHRDYARWQDAFSVGNEELDGQHRQMLDLLNRIYDSIELEQTRQPVAVFLEESDRFATIHFETEERLMAECGYPGLEEHRKAHGAYRALVAQIRQREEKEQAEDLFFFLKEWWLGHLLQVDSQYAPWLKRQGSPDGSALP
jgi:hemerythrin